MSWTFVVLALVLFIFAIYIGFLCGQWACEKRVITKRDYWIANFAGAAAVVLLTWVFSLFPLVQFAPIGWLGGLGGDTAATTAGAGAASPARRMVLKGEAVAWAGFSAAAGARTSFGSPPRLAREATFDGAGGAVTAFGAAAATCSVSRPVQWVLRKLSATHSMLSP